MLCVVVAIAVVVVVSFDAFSCKHVNVCICTYTIYICINTHKDAYIYTCLQLVYHSKKYNNNLLLNKQQLFGDQCNETTPKCPNLRMCVCVYAGLRICVSACVCAWVCRPTVRPVLKDFVSHFCRGKNQINVRIRNN